MIEKLKSYLENIDSNTWYYILPVELKEIIDTNPDSVFLLDIRRKEDFKKFHIKGSVNIPFVEVLKDKNLSYLPKDKPIIIICYVGHTASQLLVILRLLGYNAKALKFGIGIPPDEGVPFAGWLDYNYEVEIGV